jgi:hypothetical protein
VFLPHSQQLCPQTRPWVSSVRAAIRRSLAFSLQEIRLEEFKPRYDAVFLNRFEPDPEGTRYTVTVEIALNGAYG